MTMHPQSFGEFVNTNYPWLPELIGPGILPKGHVMFLYGDEGTWKSWLAIELAFALVLGFTWLLWSCHKSRVLIVNPEILPQQYQERLKDYMRKRRFNAGMMEGLFVENNLDLRLDQAFGINELEKAIQQTKVDTVIIDGLYKVVSTDVVSGSDARRIIDGLDRLRQQYNLTIIIVHHTRQGIFDSTEGRTVNLGTSEMYGSSLYRDWADTIMRVQKEPNNDDLINIWAQKTRHAKYSPTHGTFFVDRTRLRFWLAY